MNIKFNKGADVIYPRFTETEVTESDEKKPELSPIMIHRRHCRHRVAACSSRGRTGSKKMQKAPKCCL